MNKHRQLMVAVIDIKDGKGRRLKEKIMETRILGHNLKVSAVGFGCMGLSHAYGAAVDEREGINIIRGAVDAGYTFFDTAEVYGTADDPHHNEKIVGKALHGCREKVVIATKCGISFDTASAVRPYPLVPDARPETIRRSLEGSLQRLQTDYIDLYYLHRLDPKVPVEDVAGVMSELTGEGKIRAWGLSEVDGQTIRRAYAVFPPAAVQNRYHMMYRHYESLFPLLEELNIALVAFSPLANGLLSGKYNAGSVFDAGSDYRANMPQFKPEAYEANRALLELINSVAAEKGATPAQISLAWMLCKKPYIVPIPGSRKIERLRENAGAADIRLTAEEISRIDRALDNMTMSAVYGGARVEN